MSKSLEKETRDLNPNVLTNPMASRTDTKGDVPRASVASGLRRVCIGNAPTDHRLEAGATLIRHAANCAPRLSVFRKLSPEAGSIR